MIFQKKSLFFYFARQKQKRMFRWVVDHLRGGVGHPNKITRCRRTTIVANRGWSTPCAFIQAADHPMETLFFPKNK
jgi:hypothetical protein